MRKFFRGGGEISVDLSQKGGATQKRLGTTSVDSRPVALWWPLKIGVTPLSHAGLMPCA